ncbi:MAG: FKBP-type peptidyl-prolyl cis-trans isomerase [Planctomycetota bacterium]
MRKLATALAAVALAALVVSCEEREGVTVGKSDTDAGQAAKPAEPSPAEPSKAPPDAAKAAGTAAAPTAPAAAAITLDTKAKKVSYCIGLTMTRNFRAQAMDIDGEVFLRGVSDSVKGAEPLLTQEEINRTMMTFQQERIAKRKADMEKRRAMMAKQRKLAAANAPQAKAKGSAFLAANAKRPGVVALPSGLQYKVLKKGTGRKPTTADTVVCHYRGTFVDGREFDNSYKRNKPAQFPVTGVIRGWTEALQLMAVGAKWQLFIPSELAYGKSGRGTIGPNETLLFDIELVGIK